MTVTLLHGDCLEHMAALKAEGRTFSAICTDPPYHLTTIGRSLQLSKNGDGTDRTHQRNYRERGFMGKAWDGGGIAFDPQTWKLALDLLEPGGMMACFGGSRTFHRMAVAIEDAGFILRDTCMWLHAQGFPKSRSLLKPAFEPIILARKPGPLRPLAIDACRVATDESLNGGAYAKSGVIRDDGWGMQRARAGTYEQPAGRWPANICHDGSDEVLEAFKDFGERKSGGANGVRTATPNNCMENPNTAKVVTDGRGPDTGSAARFFYAAKASKSERQNSTHPCIKPLSLMRWITKLITPPGGTVLDMFCGSGTTLHAAQLEGFNAVGIEQDAAYIADASRRLGITFQLEAAD